MKTRISKKGKIVFILGLFVALTPFLGFPGSVEQTLLVIAGLLLMGVSYFIRKKWFVEEDNQSFTDNKDAFTGR